MVSLDVKLTSFEEVAEVLHSQVYTEELSIKSAIPGLGGFQCL